MELLRVEHLDKSFLSNKRAKLVHAVDDVSFQINNNEFMGLVGESGSGKSTVARILSGLVPADSGTVYLKGREVFYPYPREIYKTVQMIFQLPADSFDPRKRIGNVLEGILKRFGYREDRRKRAIEILSMVGLPSEYVNKFPSQMSGGECQRAAIARALAAEPELLICDEITSALDVSVQAQIVDLLMDLRETAHISMLLVSHDLALVQGICDRILVIKDGAIIEEGKAKEVLASPRMEYTKQLIHSVMAI